MKKIHIILILLSVSLLSLSQIKENIGIMPDSYYLNSSNDDIDHIKLFPPSKDLIKTEDHDSDKDGTMYYIGRLLPVNLTTDNSGTWSYLEDGTEIWKLRISSQGAKASALHFDYFKLQKNSKLFVYNSDYSVILGPFTSEDNPQGWEYSIGVLFGGDIIIEYILPSDAIKQKNTYKNDSADSDFKIESYSYIYRGEYLFFDVVEKYVGYGTSENCQVNVNCTEGNNWRVQQKGIARIYVREGWSSGYCTGSLINNTANDQTPYFLTAAHCGEDASTNDFRQWRFDFNYESTGCSSSVEPSKTSFTGCEKKSMAKLNGGSDFLLLKLSATTQQIKNANLVYNGWRNTDIGSSSGVSIHHPSGDIKKISTYNRALTSETYYGGNNGATNAHWEVYWTSTENGHGVTEGGSSGSPIFDANGYIIGTLSGGSSYCAYTNESDLYGKFSYHWASNGTANSLQLKPWLDPENTGATICEILDPNNIVDFTTSSTQICNNSYVQFTDLSTGNPTSWSWSFGDGSTSNEQNPSHKYTKTGEFSVTLTISKDSYSSTKEMLITVKENPEMAYSVEEASGKQVADGSIELIVSKGEQPYSYNWAHNTNLNSPIADELLPGIYNVTVSDKNNCNDSKEIKVDYFSGIIANNYICSIYPNPVENILTINFENNDIPNKIELIDLLGKVIYQSNNVFSTNKLDLSGYNSGIYFLNLEYAGYRKTQKIVLK
jgi:PKD repeat protein